MSRLSALLVEKQREVEDMRQAAAARVEEAASAAAEALVPLLLLQENPSLDTPAATVDVSSSSSSSSFPEIALAFAIPNGTIRTTLIDAIDDRYERVLFKTA